MTMIAPTKPFVRAAAPGHSWWFGGCLITSLAEAADTAGQLSAADAVIRQGMEPPLHTHSHEDEAFFILAGDWMFHIGDDTFAAGPGAFVWAPRGIPHSWTVDADGARALILCTPGGHLEAMFRPFSQPAEALELPPTPHELPLQAMLDLDNALGVVYPSLVGE